MNKTSTTKPEPADPEPNDPLTEALQNTKVQLRANEQRCRGLSRELEGVASLLDLLHQLQQNLAPYQDQEVVKMAPENKHLARVLTNLFPTGNRLIVKALALRRIDQYLAQLQAKQAALEHQMTGAERYRGVLLETQAVHRQLKQIRRRKQAQAMKLAKAKETRISTSADTAPARPRRPKKKSVRPARQRPE